MFFNLTPLSQPSTTLSTWLPLQALEAPMAPGRPKAAATLILGFDVMHYSQVR